MFFTIMCIGLCQNEQIYYSEFDIYNVVLVLCFKLCIMVYICKYTL